MYDPRQLQYGTYPPVQQSNQQQVVYTQPPAPYFPQGQQVVQQIRPPMNQQQVPPPQQIVYDIQARHIGSLEDIKLGEIPMDGSMPLFMLQDESEIVGKFWNKNAELKTIRYIKEPDQESAPEPQVPMVQTVIDPDISNRLNRLEQLINRCIETVESIPAQQIVQIEPAQLPSSATQASNKKKVSNNV